MALFNECMLQCAQKCLTLPTLLEIGMFRQLSDSNSTNRLALIFVSALAVVEHCNCDR